MDDDEKIIHDKGDIFDLLENQDNAEIFDQAETESEVAENPYSKVIRIIGVVIIIAGVIGFFVVIANPQEVTRGIYYSYTDEVINWTMAITFLVSGIISGSICLGFSEVINLLEQIKNNSMLNHSITMNSGE